MKNIILIGMMGCGKSTCGRMLARQLDREFIDTDSFIEAREGRAVAEIFAAEGEEYFRAKEREIAAELGGQEGLVIACGGGLPMQAAAMASLKKTGVVVFLDRDPEDIYDNVSMAKRPLGQAGREAFLERYRQREPIYRGCADLVVPSQPAAEETVQKIKEGLQ
jgi:shikimate kinase